MTFGHLLTPLKLCFHRANMSSFSRADRHKAAQYYGASKSDLERDSGFSGVIQLTSYI